MVVNKKGGNKTKKQKKVVDDLVERELVFKNTEDYQEYGQVTKILGNKRFEVNCFDNKTRLAHAGGSLKRKKVFVKLGDVILFSIRTFEDAKCDILHVYNKKEVKRLKKLNEIPDNINDDLEPKTEENDIGVEFGESSDEEDDSELKRKEDFKKDFESNFNAI
jgi:translation initiation factor 1A